MLGLVEESRHVTTQWFKELDDVILLLGLTRPIWARPNCCSN
jgi:hypothetical protein